MESFKQRLYVMYDHPTDYPKGFIARMWLIDGDKMMPTDEAVHAETRGAVSDFLESIGFYPAPMPEQSDKDICGFFTPTGYLEEFSLLPPTPGSCPKCAGVHGEQLPHNRDSLYYQYSFYRSHGRWPKWIDAMSHCSEQMQKFWIENLKEKGVPDEQFQQD